MAEPKTRGAKPRPETDDIRAGDIPGERAGQGDPRPPADRRQEDAERDETLDETFPASDPPPASPGAD